MRQCYTKKTLYENAAKRHLIVVDMYDYIHDISIKYSHWQNITITKSITPDTEQSQHVL